METHLALPPECGVIVKYHHAWPLLIDSGCHQFSGGAFSVVHRSAGIPGAYKPQEDYWLGGRIIPAEVSPVSFQVGLILWVYYLGNESKQIGSCEKAINLPTCHSNAQS